MKTDSNDPINMETTDSGCVGQYSGLTKREYFAAKAMQGALAADVNFNATEDSIAKWSVRYADALIEELNKE